LLQFLQKEVVFVGFLTFGFTGIIILLAWGVRIFIIVLLIKALMKYLNDEKTTPEQEIIRRSLGEALKAHRQQSGMTQEYVAEALGVSRQAVSKWETGAAEPSTSNLLALAKLYGVDPGDLLKGVQ
jgi:DNA-binding transcriptional regulator YiaG